jgi:hypothetical protein
MSRSATWESARPVHATMAGEQVIQTLPATRSYTRILANIPALMPTGGVGAETNAGQINRFTAHGGRQNEGRISVNGLLVTEPGAGAGVSSLAYDVANVDEIQVLVSGGLGEAETGGPPMNLVPRSGGNQFAGSAFYSGAGEWSRSNNVDDALRSIGILEPSALINAFDVNGSLGGPILRDRLWFFGSARTFGQATAVSGAYANLYAGDPTHWDYARDEGVVTRHASRYDIFSIRLTNQLTPRNRVSFSQENQYRCQGSTLTDSGKGCRTRSGDWIAVGNATNAPEAFPGYSPVTIRSDIRIVDHFRRHTGGRLDRLVPRRFAGITSPFCKKAAFQSPPWSPTSAK